MGHVDRKRINDALDKHLERSSPSTSRAVNGKDNDRLSLLRGKSHPDQRDSRSSSVADKKCSDELFLIDLVEFDVYLQVLEVGMASAEESETDSGSDEDNTSWISWFCNLRRNELFFEVDDDYIQDDFKPLWVK